MSNPINLYIYVNIGDKKQELAQDLLQAGACSVRVQAHCDQASSTPVTCKTLNKVRETMQLCGLLLECEFLLIVVFTITEQIVLKLLKSSYGFHVNVLH